MPTDRFQLWWKKFRETGDISPVRLGCTRDDLKAMFGEPDAVSSVTRKHKTPAIWKYGPLEFHFAPEGADTLVLIYSESPDGMVDISIPKLMHNLPT